LPLRAVRWFERRPTLTIVRTLGVIVVASFALSGWAVVKQSQASAERAADRKASNTSQVARCFQQVRDSPDVLQTLNLLDNLATNSIIANRQALKADGDPELRRIRQQSLGRLIPARASLRKLIARSSSTVPTMRSCEQLASGLHVNPEPFRNP